MLNMKIKEVLDDCMLLDYDTHDARVYGFVHDAVAKTLAFTFENIEWVRREMGMKFSGKPVRLRVEFEGVINLSIVSQFTSENTANFEHVEVEPLPLEKIDEQILGMRCTGNVVSLVTDEHDYKTRQHGGTLIKFVATNVSITEIK